MSERGYFERLSQRALVARQNAAGTGARGGANGGGEASWDNSRERLVAHRYRPEKRIGRGRLGDIFEAVDEAGRDVGANRRVAIQLIDEKIAANSRIADNLGRAYALLQTSSHPNVVRILDFGMQPRMAYVVMDLLEGVSLRSVLAEAAPEPLGVDETWPVILAVGDALQYLHAKGLTHGGLRPESVFVTLDYGVKLLDLAPHLPSLAPFYVEDAAEESKAKSDPRDDVYGLACLTYELLSGRHPFNANTPLEAHRARLEPRPLSGLSLRDWDAVARGLELRACEPHADGEAVSPRSGPDGKRAAPCRERAGCRGGGGAASPRSPLHRRRRRLQPAAERLNQRRPHRRSSVPQTFRCAGCSKNRRRSSGACSRDSRYTETKSTMTRARAARHSSVARCRQPSRWRWSRASWRSRSSTTTA